MRSRSRVRWDCRSARCERAPACSRSVPRSSREESPMWRLTDEQRELRERIREFALTEVRPRMLEVDESCDYPMDVHQALARERLLGLAIPKEYGGRGAGSV